jgi:hypothetical protein
VLEGALGVSVDDTLNGRVHSEGSDGDGEDDREDGHCHQELLEPSVNGSGLQVAGVLGAGRVVVVEPHETGVSVDEPDGEQTRDDGQELVEEGDELGDDESDDPHEQGHAHPDEPGLETLRGQQGGVSEDRDVEVFGTDVGSKDTGDNDGDEGEGVGDDDDGVGSHGQGGRLDVLRISYMHRMSRNVMTHLTTEGVDNGTDDNVGSGLGSLDDDERLLKVVGLLHLGAEGETSQRSTVGKDDVGETSNDVHQRRVLGESVPVNRSLAVGQDNVVLDTDSDHDDHSRSENTADGKTGEKVELAPLSVVRETGRRDHDDETEPDAADGVAGDGVEGLLTDEDVRSCETHRLVDVSTGDRS